ncbi:MAG: hypothetical protein EOP84_35190 [Verrucomicrobiaceae bacterium]|nr:MAG: hypothetical protein EOP84_35190 [Verrucomicrobiaceae bacterium]
MTSSSLWPEEQPYSYVDDGPTFWIDPTGLQKELPKQKAKSVLGFHYAYGNYCGGDRNPMDDCKRLNWPLPKPWDGLDACCVPHDMAYNKNKCLPFIDQRSECKNADIDICDCVRNVDCGKIHKAIQNIRLCNQMKADIMGLCSIRFAYRYSNPFRWGW